MHDLAEGHTLAPLSAGYPWRMMGTLGVKERVRKASSVSGGSTTQVCTCACAGIFVHRVISTPLRHRSFGEPDKLSVGRCYDDGLSISEHAGVRGAWAGILTGMPRRWKHELGLISREPSSYSRTDPPVHIHGVRCVSACGGGRRGRGANINSGLHFAEVTHWATGVICNPAAGR